MSLNFEDERLSPRSPGPRSEPGFIRGDIETTLGPPVTVISGVKIYDTETLHKPPLSIKRYGGGDQLIQYLEQSGGEFSHLFIRNAQSFIDQVRESARKVEGLFPPLELTIDTLRTAFRLIYDGIISKGLAGRRGESFYRTLIYNESPSRNLSLDELVNHETYYIVRRTDTNGLFLEEVAQMIKLTYAGLGYEWSYFGFVKKDHPLRMSKAGRVPLKPNTFEAFGLFHLEPDAYIEMQSKINGPHYRKSNGRQSCFKGRLEQDIPKMAGWKKQDLFDAIKRSGLWKDVTGLKRVMYGFNPETRRMGIAFKDLGLEAPNPQQEVIRGLASKPYMSMCYYETLYRRIYSTSDYIDWPLLCSLGAVTLENIRKAAIELYAAKPEEVINASAEEICRYVTETSRKRTELTRSLALATQEAREGFVGQPGSRWVQPQTMQRRGPLGEVISQPATDYQLYIAVKQYCESSQITKEQLVSYTIGLNIRSYLPDNVDQYSKGDLCEYLLDFLLPRAQRYDHVLIDCADPAIGVRQILNAATIMELGGIFPKDVSKLNKNDACRIIANYIKLLREGVDLNLARQPRKVSD